jgi:pyroglutamyl-peptidase
VDVELGPLTALELVGTHGSPALLAFGLDASRTSVMVERLAVNLYEHGDSRRPLTPRGPAAYWSTLPVDEIREAVRDVGVACELSLSAGAFVCNAVLFRALEAGIPTAFVHLPADLDPEQGAQVVAAAVSVVDANVPVV